MSFNFYKNMEDIIYCGNEDVADEIRNYFSNKGHTVIQASEMITNGTHGQVPVKAIYVYKEKDK